MTSIFTEWFTTNLVVGGDWRFFWPETLRDSSTYANAWDASLNTGIGASNLTLLWLNTYLSFGSTFLLKVLHIPWNISEKILFFWPIVILSFFSAFFLFKHFKKNNIFAFIAGCIYLTNTYALMLFSGGQVGVALGYSILPWVMERFLSLRDVVLIKDRGQNVNLWFKLLFFSLVFALQILFDIRLGYITAGILLFYLFWEILFKSNQYVKDIFFVFRSFMFSFVMPMFVALLLHAFWLLPFFVFRPTAGEQFSSHTAIEGVKFFSFGDFSHALSLLHPNWPENIFGKTSFLQPEFLIIPILAFLALLLQGIEGRRERKNLLFLSLVGLLGVFLAKGTNPPFGEVYSWMFTYIPGFFMFRDSSKFYLLISLSYAMLIPYVLLIIKENIAKILSGKISHAIVISVFLLYWIFTLRPLLFGKTSGTFAHHMVPLEYVQLKDFLSKKPNFYRTLWIPKLQRYGYFSNNHPAIGRGELIKEGSPTEMGDRLEKLGTEKLRLMGIKYIIIPYDSENEIFLADRKYSDALYKETVKRMNAIPWLLHKKTFGKILVYELTDTYDRFFVKGSGKISRISALSASMYEINIESTGKDKLVFSDSFDKNWYLRFDSTKVYSQSFNDSLNSFDLPQSGRYSVSVVYEPQEYVNIGLIISGISLWSCLLLLIYLRMMKA